MCRRYILYLHHQASWIYVDFISVSIQRDSFHTLYFFSSAIFVNIPQRIRKNRWMWDKFLISQFLIATLWLKEKNEVFFIVFYSSILRWGVMGKWFCRKSAAAKLPEWEKQMCIYSHSFNDSLTIFPSISLLISMKLFCGNARYV